MTHTQTPQRGWHGLTSEQADLLLSTPSSATVGQRWSLRAEAEHAPLVRAAALVRWHVMNSEQGCWVRTALGDSLAQHLMGTRADSARTLAEHLAVRAQHAALDWAPVHGLWSDDALAHDRSAWVSVIIATTGLQPSEVTGTDPVAYLRSDRWDRQQAADADAASVLHLLQVHLSDLQRQHPDQHPWDRWALVYEPRMTDVRLLVQGCQHLTALRMVTQ